MTNESQTARIDRLVEGLIETTPAPADWSAYVRAKRAVDEACDGDQRQYERAIRRYCKAVGL